MRTHTDRAEEEYEDAIVQLSALHEEEDGLATAEYGIVMLAAVGFAGLLTVVLTSDTVQGLLQDLATRALSQ